MLFEKRGPGFGISCQSFCAVWKTRSGFRYFMSEFLCCLESDSELQADPLAPWCLLL